MVTGFVLQVSWAEPIVTTSEVGAHDASDASDAFDAFVARVEPSLRRALVARYGHDRGRDATAEALAYAWRERDRVLAMANPAGYLYRVGQSRSRRFLPTRAGFAPAPAADPAPFEPGLVAALAALSPRQREAVVLCVGHGWTLAEVAERTGTNRSSVQKHLTRGLAALRTRLGVTIEVDALHPLEKSDHDG